MPRSLPLFATREITTPHSSAVYMGLVTIFPVDGGAPQRLCTDPVYRLSDDPLRYGLVSRGNVYDYLPMKFQMPGSNMSALPATELQTANIDAAVVEAVKTSIYRAQLRIESVFSTRPNDVVEAYPEMEVVEASWDDDVVSISVGYPSLETIPLVRHRLTVRVCPALRNVGQG